MKKILPYLLGALSGFLIVSSFVTPLPGFLVLLGFIPLLFAENMLTETTVRNANVKVFLLALICFFIENITLQWGLAKLLSYWAVLFFIFNSLLSAAVFLLFSVVKRKLGVIWGYASWIVFTTAYEFLCLNVNFSFPALLTGNLIFGSGSTSLIQWYEYTGVLGGTMWILLCNLLQFLLLKSLIERKSMKAASKLWISSGICILLPIVFSVYLYAAYTEKTDPIEFVVIQPNIDPYTEKFAGNDNEQVDKMIELAKENITPETSYIIFPETALIGNIWLNNIAENHLVTRIKDSLLMDYPHAKVIAGADMMQYYVVHDGKAPTPWAKQVDDKVYYDFFNAVLQIDVEGRVEVYKKSKLVLGTEYVPFVQRFPGMKKLLIKFGGNSQSRGRQYEPNLLNSEITSVAAVICFESLFGDYVSQFIKMGGEIICVITNDGWWDGTPIARYHFRYAQLRAIENRRSLVRCANTGISGFIDQRGDIVETSDWWVPVSMRHNVNKNKELTFYTRYGDYIGIICSALSLVIILFLLYTVIAFRRKK